MLIKNVVSISLSLFLFSCAIPYVKEDVQAQNWQALGKHDAEMGQIKKSEAYLNKIALKFDCGEVDVKAYEKAYRLAQDEYCEIRNAFILGLTGKSYLGICRGYPHGQEFFNKWDGGRRAFTGHKFY